MSTIEALLPFIRPAYIRKAPITDAWGDAYAYAASADGSSYRLVSPGSDGRTDPDSWGVKGPLASFEDDAVLDSGSLSRP